MKITDVEVNVLEEIPFPAPIHPPWQPGVVWRGASYAIVSLHTDQGLVGIGAGDARSAKRVREGVSPYLVGQDPSLIEKHVSTLARIGRVWSVEIALWDLLGKAADLPLYKLWGGYTDRIKAYASLTEVGQPEGRAEDAQRLWEEGFRALKLRIHNDTVSEDIALVQAVREAVGDGMEIMVDANQANVVPSEEAGPTWDLKRAIWTAKRLEELGVAWLEEPLGRYDFSALAELRSSVEIPIAGGENNRTLSDFVRMVRAGTYDILQADVVVSGVSGTRKVAALAEAAGLIAVGHHGGTGLGLLTHLHINAACPNAPVVEYFYDPPKFPVEIFQGMLEEPLRVDREGYLWLPQKPGLGVELDEEFIRHYSV